MIDVTLKFIAAQLNEFLKRATNENKTLVKLAGFEAPSRDASFNHPLTLSLLNITQEVNIPRKPANGVPKQVPPLFLNLYILLRSNGQKNAYTEGLHWLSTAVHFFQQNPIFTSVNFQMPEHIDKLSFELVNLDLEAMGKFWDALETSYQPSVIYKVRLLKIDDFRIEMELPKIKSTN